MSAHVIDGRACARALKESVAAEIEQLREGGARTGLATVMVGDGYSSSAYERRRADVLIVAAGRPGLIGPEHVNDHAVVIDVGVNPRPGPGGRNRMVGDVDHEAVAARVRAITPVPGGVGPVTDVWLLRNTAAAARALNARAVAGARSGGNLLSSLEPS